MAMMKRIAVVMLAGLFVMSSIPVAAQAGGSIGGTATSANNSVLSGVRVQLRNANTGQLAGNTTSGTNGAWSFTGLNPGNYVVEIVDAAGHVIGVSSSISLAAGGAISGVTVAASAAGALAGAAAAGGLSAFFTSTGGILVLAGVGAAAAAGVLATQGAASASK
jgi:hypothetical protein